MSAIDAKLARRDGRSFLRPDYLLPARNDLKTGHIAAAELRGDRQWIYRLREQSGQ